MCVKSGYSWAIRYDLFATALSLLSMSLLASVRLVHGAGCHLNFPVLAPTIKQATMTPTLFYEIQFSYLWLDSGNDSSICISCNGR